ncbi:unnamed protein product [Lepeophtheirus salmonis]|uniref:(salmon louse) hypothetical protein n=1 Tax=Lepeophtheirus salmonis TaxID=72036 RepID=A0A7R8H971_LEPSM|nr:unnamed protein product [Lepeophtheirus salmonis]CAF2951783.1 unnamed protein product [Lepeophtheirus salmonis]
MAHILEHVLHNEWCSRSQQNTASAVFCSCRSSCYMLEIAQSKSDIELRDFMSKRQKEREPCDNYYNAFRYFFRSAELEKETPDQRQVSKIVHILSDLELQESYCARPNTFIAGVQIERVEDLNCLFSKIRKVEECKPESKIPLDPTLEVIKLIREGLINKYKDVFSTEEELKCMKGDPLKIYFKEGYEKFAICTPRTIPFLLRYKVKEERKQMMKKKIIKIVSKSNGGCSLE